MAKHLKDEVLQVLDAIDRLKKNILQEQTLLLQTLCIAHQQYLAPEQVEQFIISFPYILLGLSIAWHKEPA